MQTFFPNCIPQYQYKLDEASDDNWLENKFCPICGKEEVYLEENVDDEGFKQEDYWCDNCQKFINLIEKN
jgi:ribosomal protein S27AE